MQTLTNKQIAEVRQRGEARFTARCREANLPEGFTLGELNGRQVEHLADIMIQRDTAERAELVALRESEQLLDLSLDGVPTVSGGGGIGVKVDTPADTDPMRALAEEGIPLREVPSFMRTTQTGRRVMGLRETTGHDPVKAGLEELTRRAREREQRAREAERLSDESPVPTTTAEAAQEFIDDEQKAATGTRSDGTIDLGHHVPMTDDAGTGPADTDDDDLLDLGREVPKAGPVERRPVADVLAEADDLEAEAA